VERVVKTGDARDFSAYRKVVMKSGDEEKWWKVVTPIKKRPSKRVVTPVTFQPMTFVESTRESPLFQAMT